MDYRILFIGAAWLLLGVLTLYRLVTKSMTETRAVFLLIAAGFLLRLFYVLYTPVTLRQHDVYSFSGAKGHAGYIMYFYEHLRLPDFSPDSVSQFYHPPLHHFLEALWMRLQTTLGLSLETAAENTQLLTLLYSSLCLPVLWKILRLLRLSGRALLIPLAIFCFHPSFIIMAGSINNDMLMTLLTLTAVMCALRWYQAPSVRRILPIALTLGLAMSAKFSASLAAPAIGLLFLMRFVSDLTQNPGPVRRKLVKQYLGQFGLFLLVCCPLGLWWTLYSYFVWDVPFGYVPSLSLTSHQYIGDYPLWRRFIITPDQLSSVYLAWADQPGFNYNEYNMITGFLKTSVFDESVLFRPEALTGFRQLLSWAGAFFSVVLFYSNFLLVLISAAAIVYCLVRRLRLNDSAVTLSMVFLGGFVLLSYISFCLGYPHTCTQNFRYAIPTLLTGGAFLGRFLQEADRRRISALSRGAATFVTLLTLVFCSSSAAVYILLGMV